MQTLGDTEVPDVEDRRTRATGEVSSAESGGTAEAAIVSVALDYFEGWFDGDADRMRRALHPGLAKRSLEEDGWALNETTAEWMIDATAKHLGKTRDVPDRRIEVEAVDVYRDIATAIVRSAVYREYIQLVRTRDGWKIVNVLWAWS